MLPPARAHHPVSPRQLVRRAVYSRGVTPAELRTLSSVRAALARLERYDDESVVHDDWIRQRYQGGFAETYAPARKEAVSTAWHEAGHAVAALAVGARFSSVSIRAGSRSSGRVHSIAGGGADSFVIAAGGRSLRGLGWLDAAVDRRGGGDMARVVAR